MESLYDLKNLSLPLREEKILQLIDSPRTSYYWVPLTIQNIKILVMGDALKIDNIRINASAKTMQTIADKLDAVLPTAKICDLIWLYADIRISPCPMKISSSLDAMINHSNNIDKQLSNIDVNGKLISTVGKYWVITNKLLTPKIPNQAANYGWHFVGNSFFGINGNPNESLLKDSKGLIWKLIQPLSFFHDFNHTDYSQTVTLISKKCWVNGEERDIRDVLKDKTLSKLLSNEGEMKLVRQPGVPEIIPEKKIPETTPAPNNIQASTLEKIIKPEINKKSSGNNIIKLLLSLFWR